VDAQGTPLQAAQAAVNVQAQQRPARQQNVAPPQNVPMAAIPGVLPAAAAAPPGVVPAPPGPAPPVGVAIAPQIRAAIDRQTRVTTASMTALRNAVNRISQQQDLTPAEVSTVLTNLEGGPDPLNPALNIPPAPLTAQLLAQGKLQMRQLLVPADVQSYEKALRDRRVTKQSDGREQRVYTSRLRAQPVLTRYVEDPVVKGAKFYRRPRFAGAAY
jgi:hypothetical protein